MKKILGVLLTFLLGCQYGYSQDDNGKAMSEPIMGAVDEKNFLKVLDTVEKGFNKQKKLEQFNYTKSKL